MDLLVRTILQRPQPFQDAYDGASLFLPQFYRDQEEFLYPPAPFQQQIPWLAIIIRDENEAANLPVPNFPLEQEELPVTPLLLAAETTTWLAQQLGDEEILSRSPYNILDDDAFVASFEIIPWQARPFLDDEIYCYLSAQEEQQEVAVQLRFATQQTTLKAVVFIIDEEWPKGFPVDEELITIRSPVLAQWISPVAIDNGNDLPQLYIDQQEPLVLLTQRVSLVQPALWVPYCFADEEAGASLSALLVDQVDWSVGATQALPWLALPFLDGAEQGSMRVSGLDQEEFNNGGSLQLLSNSFVQYLPPDDPSSSGLGYFALEDDRAAYSPTQRLDWLSLPATYDELSTPLVFFTLEQEEPYTAAVQAICWLSRPSLDDELLSGATNFGIDLQEPSYPQTQATPWLWSSPASDEIGATLARFGLEDERQPDYQLETVCWLSRPSLDDELYPRFGLEDERPYVATVQSISWLALPFSYDEIASYLPYDDDPPYLGHTQRILWNCIIVLGEEIMVLTPAIAPSRRLRLIGWDSTIISLQGDGQ